MNAMHNAKSLFPGFLLLIFLILSTVTVKAQEAVANTDIPMADQLRADGKIWVVVAVILSLLAGLLIYLIRLDRKVSRLEGEMGLK
jgi:bacteriorhodopsin